MKRNGTVKKPSRQEKKQLLSTASPPVSSSASSSSGEIILGSLRQLSPFLLPPSSSSSSSPTSHLILKSTQLKYSIGANGSCDYLISDPHISSHHCHLSITIPSSSPCPDPSSSSSPSLFQYSLHDTSTNGTYVNNKLIHHTSCPLRSGDHIDFFITSNGTMTTGPGDRLSFIFQLNYDDDQQGDDDQGQGKGQEQVEGEEEEPATKKRKTLMKTKSLPSKISSSSSTPSAAPPPPVAAAAPAFPSSASGTVTVEGASAATGAPAAAGATGAGAPAGAGAAAGAGAEASGVRNEMASLLEEKLQCSICCEVIYQASTTVPCMHSYCGGCISSWLQTSNKCPLCNHRIEQINRNHVLNDMISDLVKMKPEVDRTESDKKELERKNQIQYGTKLQRRDAGDEDEEEDEDEEDEEDEDDEEEDEEDDGHAFVPPPYRPPRARAPPPAVAVAAPVITPAMRNDIESFQRITGCSESEATRYVTGAAQRGLVPHLDNALSYYFEQMG